MSEKRHWLFKTEPGAYSIDDLKRDNKTTWDGVRNYQARNMLRDDISEGDRVLFYHSNTDPPVIVGTATVIRNGYPDHTQFEQGHPKFDPKASPDSPRWYMVDIQFEQAFTEPIPLDRLRDIPALKEMELLRKGSRLSVQPVSKKEWDAVMRIAR